MAARNSKRRAAAAALVTAAAILLLGLLVLLSQQQQQQQQPGGVTWQLLSRWHVLSPTTAAAATGAAVVSRPRAQQQHSSGSISGLVIIIVSAHRQGGSYLANTVSSLRCALAANHTSNSTRSPQQQQLVEPPPQVLLVNTQIPPEAHTAMMSLQQDAEWTQGLQLLNVTELHSKLHAPAFVLELSARAGGAPGSQVNSSNGLLAQAARDPADRLWWRSKEALDTAYALEAAVQASPAAYVVFLQDDIVLAAGFDRQLQDLIASESSTSNSLDVITLFVAGQGPTGQQPVRLSSPWLVPFGCVGFAIRREVVMEVVSYIRDRFHTMPVDWLLNEFIVSSSRGFWAFRPDLVQHVGRTSSLAGKTQPASSATFADRTCWFS